MLFFVSFCLLLVSPSFQTKVNLSPCMQGYDNPKCEIKDVRIDPCGGGSEDSCQVIIGDNVTITVEFIPGFTAKNPMADFVYGGMGFIRGFFRFSLSQFFPDINTGAFDEELVAGKPNVLRGSIPMNPAFPKMPYAIDVLIKGNSDDEFCCTAVNLEIKKK